MKLFRLLFLFILFEIIPMNGFSFSVWNQKPNFPGVGRHRGTGIAIADKGYFGLGHVNGTGVNIPYADWWEFDPATNSWTQKSDYPVANYGSLAFSAQNKGYVGGGVFLNGEFYEFNPITNTWLAIADAPINASDNIAFSVNNMGYITNGASLYEYNVSADTWSIKQSPPLSINTWSSACAVQNSAYVKIGNKLYEYKPANDIWLQKSNYPGLATGGGVAFSIHNKCYFLLGYMGSLGNVTKEMWEYNPATNNWILQPEFDGTSRRFASAFSINEKGYVGIGTNGINFSDLWEYNRVLDKQEYNNSNFMVQLYPNPCSDFIIFDFSSNSYLLNTEIHIYSSIGKRVKEVKSPQNKVSVNLVNMTAGQYFYCIKQGGNTIKNGQFIIN